MTHNPIRYYLCDLFSGQVLDEMPFTTMSFNRTKNHPGGWTADIPRNSLRLSSDVLRPWTKAVYVGRNERILFGGILMNRHIEAAGPISVGGAGFFEYLRGDGRRVINNRGGMAHATGLNQYEVTFTQVDQFNIVKDLIDHAANYAGQANVSYDGVRFHGPLTDGLTGRLRDRTYWTYERKSIGEAIEQLAAVIDGFDFSESYSWSTTTNNKIDRFLDLWYPYKGIQQELQFQLGINVVLLTSDEVGDELATRATATGAGEGDAQLQQTHAHTSLEYPNGPYPLLEWDEDYPDVSIPETAYAHAEADQRTRQAPIETVELEVAEQGHYQDLLGVFDWGDSVWTYGSDGGLELAAQYRVENLQIEINEQGSVQIKPSMATWEASTRT